MADLPIDDCWAGLRPRSRDGVPVIGRVEGVSNLTIAAGHFRSGIHLAPITAALVADILAGNNVSDDRLAIRPN